MKKLAMMAFAIAIAMAAAFFAARPVSAEPLAPVAASTITAEQNSLITNVHWNGYHHHYWGGRPYWGYRRHYWGGPFWGLGVPYWGYYDGPYCRWRCGPYRCWRVCW